MTCLVAWRGKQRTFVGADTQWSAGTSKGVQADGKIFRHGKYVIGLAGSLRTIQVLRYVVPLFDPKVAKERLMHHLFTEWLPVLQDGLDKAGQINQDADKQLSVPLRGLIVSRSQIITIGPDLTVAEVPERYAAAGSAEDIALGVMAAAKVWGRAVDDDIVRQALIAAEKHNNTVGKPYTILEVW